jgi:HEAT repeat protein
LIEKTIAEDLTNPDHRMRMRTIHMLVEKQHPGAVLLLLPLLHDREMPVRNAAIVALGMFSDSRAFEPLLACLAAPITLERKNAVQSLDALGDPRRLDPLLDALRTEINSSVRLEIIKAISAFSKAEVIETLIRLLTDRDEDVRVVAAIALGRIGEPQAIPALQQMALTDTNQETSIHGLYERNSTVARRAIQMILYPEREQDLDWPD